MGCSGFKLWKLSYALGCMTIAKRYTKWGRQFGYNHKLDTYFHSRFLTFQFENESFTYHNEDICIFIWIECSKIQKALYVFI